MFLAFWIIQTRQIQIVKKNSNSKMSEQGHVKVGEGSFLDINKMPDYSTRYQTFYSPIARHVFVLA